jgi:hypothetical protein
LGGGAPGDFALVRHSQLAGPQREIGFDLAELAWENHGVQPQRSTDASMTRARRRWRRANWPELEERACGVADRWQLPVDDDAHECAALPIGFPHTSCSVVVLPPDRTSAHTTLVSRNFDFPTLSMYKLIGATSGDDDPPFCSQPYVLETYPTTGHATLTVTAFDPLAGVVDGINDAGLVAALNSDDESTTGGASTTTTEPTFTPAVGLSEVEFCRYILERCADVDEAPEAVRVARHYYLFHPQHFTVADRSGRSFVYEFSPGRNTEYVTWNDGVQIVTNHLLYRYPTVNAFPADDVAMFTFGRFKTLQSLFADQPTYTPEEVAARHATLRVVAPGVPVRTLWYTLYDTDAAAMTATFHLRDSQDGEIRTAPMRFELNATRALAPATRQTNRAIP